MSFLENINEQLHRKRYMLLIVAISIVVATVGFVIYTEINNNHEQQSLKSVEAAIELFESYDGENAEDKTALMTALDNIIERYPRRYATARALFIRAEVHWADQEWDAATEYYMLVVEQFPNSHLTPVSLYNAAAAFEENNDIEQAVTTLEQLINASSIGSEIDRAHALFSLGRLYEKQQDLERAAEYYNRLLDRHESSGWANLAQNRLTALTISGKL